MQQNRSPSCFLIGADSLLIECGEILLRQGFEVRGVITRVGRICDWAASRSLTTVDLDGDYRGQLARAPFDYLFSITHLQLLPADVLALPRRRAINFHDGPLPRYAGLNAPVWALLNRESTYGITWHEMTAGVDEGDILLQREFELSPDETSLSLNTKCFEHAIDTFEELATALRDGTAQPRPQPRAGRSEFRRYDRPPAACLIDWQRPAAELEALVRALDFGPYPNPIGVAKVQVGGRPYGVHRARAIDGAAEAAPGTVLTITDDAVTVTTGSGVLALSDLSTVCGRALTVAQFETASGIRVGATFDSLDKELGDRLTTLNARLARSESRWLRRLVERIPVDLPYVDSAHVVRSDDPIVAVEVEVPAALGGLAPQAPAAALITGCAAFVGRLSGSRTFDLGYADPELAAAVDGVEALVAADVPVRWSLAEDADFATALASAGEALAVAHKDVTWLRDAPSRLPALVEIAGVHAGSALPVAIRVRSGAEPGEPIAGSALTFSISIDGTGCTLLGNGGAIVERELGVVAGQLATFLRAVAAAPDRPLGEQPLLDDSERRTVIETWNDTAIAFDETARIHELIRRQAERTPAAIAAWCGDQSLTYRELGERSRRLAARLRRLGVGPDVLVGLCVERSLDLLVAVVGVLEAGGAYVPLDPAYPADRLAFMIEDSRVPVLVTQRRLRGNLPAAGAHVVELEALVPGDTDAAEPAATGSSSDLAYVIYTSGSTGKPKGVMVEHRNVVNFFRGMDERITAEEGDTWLAVTSLSFDISVLELLWTLSRGLTVVVHAEDKARGSGSLARRMDFGIFLWGNDDGPGAQKYRLMMEAAKFADRHGFASIWTPERHFHAFGGPFPNPSVTSAAIAAVTERIAIRSGSCVAPLHHPIRIAEEWAVVDNLSNGRVGLSFAAGWQPNDFVLAPQNYPDNKEVMFRQIDQVRRLWRGEALRFTGPMGEVERATLPRPVQAELPVWVTSAGNPDTYRRAGAVGANVLTHLLGQSVREVAEKIRIYREALVEHGFDADHGKVTLMLHAFVGDDDATVRELVREPMKRYLGASVSLVKKYAWSFPAFKRPQGSDAPPEIDLESLTEAETDAVLEHAFERYFDGSGLFGSVDTCMRMVEQLVDIGVDEIGCLIDYGVPTDRVLTMLHKLAELRQRVDDSVGPADEDRSIASEIRRHAVTHLQCTPSMARMLLADPQARAALGSVRHLLLGGEALPPSLARELNAAGARELTNMYGPTETTVWSSTHRVPAGADEVPIGTPIANTQFYVLDQERRPLPPGVAGELWIGGAGVVRGYLSRPELTAERFVANPFRAGERMYRTGDLARWRHDGVMDFLGRGDHQVKLRGYRIELGEIEARMAAVAGVRQAVVLAREDVPGDQRLVGYLVGEVDTEALRQSLRRDLPEFMVPGQFVTLPALPQTPNGKIDRKALPPPEATAAPKVATALPEGDLEERIAQAWREVLGVAQVGRSDNFFDIGGHSLLIVRLHRLMREIVDVPLQLTDLYRFPTIAGLAEHAGSGGGSSAAVKQSLSRAQARRSARRR